MSWGSFLLGMLFSGSASFFLLLACGYLCGKVGMLEAKLKELQEEDVEGFAELERLFNADPLLTDFDKKQRWRDN